MMLNSLTDYIFLSLVGESSLLLESLAVSHKHSFNCKGFLIVLGCGALNILNASKELSPDDANVIRERLNPRLDTIT